MQQPSIWVVSPDGYPHSQAFDELAVALHGAFGELGMAAPVVQCCPQEGQAIVLGANLLPDMPERPPPGSVLYNLEQITPGSPWLTEGYLGLLRQFPVWDYSRNNIQALRAMGITASLCEVGYVPALTRIDASAEQDIDVLFVGSVNERRARVGQALEARGVRVLYRFGCYGSERDALIARSRIVLNLHYYESRVFEIVRVSYLLANRCCVVSETGLDTAMEHEFEGAVAFAPYDGLVAACLDLLADAGERRRLADHGLAAMRGRPQATYLQQALENSGVKTAGGQGLLARVRRLLSR